MSLTSKKKQVKYLFEIKALLSAFLLACGLWYVVVGNDHLESNIAVRVEYGSLPENLVVADGRIETLYVRVKSSTELLKRLDNQNIIYRVGLDTAKRGVNVIPVNMNEITDLSGFKLIGVDPQYIIMEVDEIKTKVLPIRMMFEAFDEEDLYVSNLRISPSMVEVKGPANLLDDLEYISIPFELNKVANEGHYSRPLQLILPDHVETTHPVINVEFDVDLETSTVEITRPVVIHTLEGFALYSGLVSGQSGTFSTTSNAPIITQKTDAELVENMNFNTVSMSNSLSTNMSGTSQEYILRPRAVKLMLDVPLSKITEETLELNLSSQVVAYVNEVENMNGASLRVQVNLPRHVKLISVEPEVIRIEEK